MTVTNVFVPVVNGNWYWKKGKTTIIIIRGETQGLWEKICRCQKPHFWDTNYHLPIKNCNVKHSHLNFGTKHHLHVYDVGAGLKTQF